MCKFIQLTIETGTGKDTIYVNVEQIASARFSVDDKSLKITMANGEEHVAEGEEAASALAGIRSRILTQVRPKM